MVLPALPMGTIMAACMLLGALAVAAVAPRPRGARAAPARLALAPLAAVLGAAGLWQLGWYFPRHPTEGWGLAALGSGALLLAGGAWCGSARVRRAAATARWPVAAGLGALGLVYAVAITRL